MPLTLPPGRLRERLLQAARDPRRDRRRDRAPARAWPTASRRGASTSARSRGASTPSAPASAWTPTSCARVDARPRLKARFGPYFFLADGARDVRAPLPAARRRGCSSTVGGETFAGVTTIVQNAEHYTYFHDRPIDLAAGATLDGGTLAGVVLRRASLLGAPSLLRARVLGAAASARHRQVARVRGRQRADGQQRDRPAAAAAGRRRLHRRGHRGALRDPAARADRRRLGVARRGGGRRLARRAAPCGDARMRAGAASAARPRARPPRPAPRARSSSVSCSRELGDGVGQRRQRRGEALEHLDVALHRIGGAVQRGDRLAQRAPRAGERCSSCRCSAPPSGVDDASGRRRRRDR